MFKRPLRSILRFVVRSLHADLVVALLTVPLLSGCNGSSSNSSGVDDGFQSSGGTSSGTGAMAGDCSTPNEGCACESYGTSIDCGQVHRRSGDYLSCSLGKRTCVNGHWGACLGDRISGQVFSPVTGRTPLALGSAGACLNNPCDPYCVNVVDSASGLDAGANFAVTDAGALMLTQREGGTGTNPCTGLTISPGPQTMTVTSISPLALVPGSLNYTATLTPASCAKVSVPATWKISNEDIAAVSSTGTVNVYVPVAAAMTVTAYAGSWVATTTANILVAVQDKSKVTATVAAIFDGLAVGTDNAAILYPYANTVFPRAVKAPVLQWDNGGTAATAVRYFVRYPTTGSPTFSWSSIVTEGSKPNAVIPPEVWSALDQTAKGSDALIGIQRLAGGVLKPEISRSIHFSTAPLRGQIYYTEYGRSGINPAPALGATCSFGLNGSVIRSLDPTGTSSPVNPFQTVAPGGCPVCHSVAANGRMFVTSDRGWGSGGGVSRINSDGTFTPIADSPQPPKTGEDSRGFAYAAITPDGQYVLQGSNLWGNTKAGGVTTPTRISAGNGNGLYSDYFANTTLAGTAAKHGIDRTIDNAWGSTSPAAGVSGGSFSARYTGQIQAYTTETYKFELEASDGVRLWVNSQLIIDNWATNNPAVKSTGSIAMNSGQKYDIKLEYYDSTNAATLKLRWSSTQTAQEIIPETQLYAR